MASKPILDIRDLRVQYRSGGRWISAVDDFSLTIQQGQTVGLVGESGSGKSTVALAVMGYLGGNGRVEKGEIWLNGRDLSTLSSAEMRQVWGDQLNLVPQDPQTALNPALKVRQQMAESLQVHGNLSRSELDQAIVDLLTQVRIPDPERVADSYPHQLSGGMQQRVLIAMALSTNPTLLVLDEPTTGLDVTTQAAVLDLFRDLITAGSTSALYVTHNLGVVAQICDRVAVMYAGELVEEATTAEIFEQPLHPYTAGLLDSVPQVGQTKETIDLQAIPGRIPPLGQRPTGCVFAPRCPVAIEACRAERPPLEQTPDGRQVRCIRWQEVADGTLTLRRSAESHVADSSSTNGRQLLAATDLKVHFEANRGLRETIQRIDPPQVKAVDGISLTLAEGQTLGIVGESGSGKTTLARAIVGLVPRSEGELALFDVALPADVADRSVETRRMLQYVFQNPDEALNPYLTVGETLRRPYMSLMDLGRDEADARVAELLESVNLPASYAFRLPSQLSGGEKQRVAIARAFATHPALLIADEPVSALDVSVQAAILNLLRELQRDQGNSLLLISHDLAVVGYLADVVGVMYVGNLMELASAETLFRPPYHPYTEALIAAIPSMTVSAETEDVRLAGDVPSQLNLPTGCPFHPRCPRYLGDICRDETPPWQVSAEGDHIFCHIPLAELEAAQRTEGGDA